MKRLTLLLLLATTATCCGQSSEQILNSIGSSGMSADLVVTEPSYTNELEQLDRHSNEATQHQYDTIRREEQIEALREQPQQDNTVPHLVKLNMIERSVANNRNDHRLLVKVNICLAGTRHRPTQRRQCHYTIVPRMVTVNQVATSTNLQNKMIELYMNRLPVMRKEDHTYLLVIFPRLG